MKNAQLNMRRSLGTFGCLPPAQLRTTAKLQRTGALRRRAIQIRTAPSEALTTSVATGQPVQAPESALPCADIGPREVWWRLEDLWLRLSQHAAVNLVEDCTECRLVATGGTQAAEGEPGLLCAHAEDAQSYTWRIADRQGSFAQLIGRQGIDLVWQLQPLWRIESWPEGPEVLSMVQGFLAGLRLNQRQVARCRATA